MGYGIKFPWICFNYMRRTGWDYLFVLQPYCADRNFNEAEIKHVVLMAR